MRWSPSNQEPEREPTFIIPAERTTVVVAPLLQTEGSKSTITVLRVLQTVPLTTAIILKTTVQGPGITAIVIHPEGVQRLHIHLREVQAAMAVQEVLVPAPMAEAAEEIKRN